MSQKIGVNLRVSQWGSQGGRPYMEDRFSIHYQKNDNGELVFAYFGLFDGHGGSEAAKFARDNLLSEITKFSEFWSDNDEDICKSIRAGFVDTHHAMWKEIDNWPRTLSGFPSTSGTTATVAIVKNSKLYIGHVGDSAVVLGTENECDKEQPSLSSILLTKDHKPDCPEERTRIERCGGSVELKSGIQRVVWNRPRRDHQGPVRRSTPIDRIPFLAVARSLGDLWSYDYTLGKFSVSPEPDVTVQSINPSQDRCLVVASDGLWNMISPKEACDAVNTYTSRSNYAHSNIIPSHSNIAQLLVSRALLKWNERRVKADNITTIVVLFERHNSHHMTSQSCHSIQTCNRAVTHPKTDIAGHLLTAENKNLSSYESSHIDFAFKDVSFQEASTKLIETTYFDNELELAVALAEGIKTSDNVNKKSDFTFKDVSFQDASTKLIETTYFNNELELAVALAEGIKTSDNVNKKSVSAPTRPVTTANTCSLRMSQFKSSFSNSDLCKSSLSTCFKRTCLRRHSFIGHNYSSVSKRSKSSLFSPGKLLRHRSHVTNKGKFWHRLWKKHSIDSLL